MFSEIIATLMKFIITRSNLLPSFAIVIIILFTALLFLSFPFSASNKLFTQSIALQALSALQLLSRIAQRRRKRMGVRRAAGHFTKEQASEAKTQCSPKVITTHRVSCDIFIIEVRGNKKGRKKTRSAALSSLCTCTTFRPASVIPRGNIMW